MRAIRYNVLLIIFFVLVSNTFFYYNTFSSNVNSNFSLEIKPNTSNSKPIKLIWNRTRDVEFFPHPTAIEIDPLNNSYIAGYFNLPYELYLLKYDEVGNFQWKEEWGGINEDGAVAMAINSINEIYVVGVTESFGSGASDSCLLKYNSSGNLLWEAIWGGIQNDYSWGIEIDSSNNLFVGGATNSYGAGDYDIFLLKYNSSGVLKWNITWGSIESEGAKGIALDSSDNIYLGGEFTHNNITYIMLTKFDNGGNFQWNRTYMDVNATGSLISMIIDSQNNIYLLAHLYKLIEGDLYSLYSLIKYNYLGEFQWKHELSNSYSIKFNSINVDSSDNIYAVGIIQPSIEDQGDFYLKKLNSLGKEKWSYSWNVSEADYCYDVDLNSVDDIYVVGTSMVPTMELYVAKFEEIPPSENKIVSYEPLILISIIFAISVIIIYSKTKKIIGKN